MPEIDDSTSIPCAPRHVLQTVCQKCHSNPTQNGAPFPLVTRSNIVRKTADGEIRALMLQQLDLGRMPLAPATIDENSKYILMDWLQAGAPALSTPSTCTDESDAGAVDASDAASQ